MPPHKQLGLLRVVSSEIDYLFNGRKVRNLSEKAKGNCVIRIYSIFTVFRKIPNFRRLPRIYQIFTLSESMEFVKHTHQILWAFLTFRIVFST